MHLYAAMRHADSTEIITTMLIAASLTMLGCGEQCQNSDPNRLATFEAAWRGDSGGPQFYNGRQVGVASTADGRTRQNYGSVANSRAWITSVSGV